MVTYASSLLKSFNHDLRIEGHCIRQPFRVPSTTLTFKTIPFSRRILATSAANYDDSRHIRKYGCDYQELTPKNISLSVGLVLLKSIVVVGSAFQQEQNAVNDHNINLAEQDLPLLKFDWDDIKRRYLTMFKQTLIRLGSIESIKKFYEYMAMKLVSPKLFDRLTKQPVKSLQRKYSKNICTAYILSYKMASTCAWSSVIYYASQLTLDAIAALYDYHRNPPTGSASALVRSRVVLVWTFKRVATSACLVVGSSLGFSFGIYFNHSYGGPCLQVVGEVAAAALAAHFIGVV